MRIYQPKNELGQAILNEGQLVATAKTITKNIVDGAITLTDSDVSGIANWDVKSVQVTIGGQKMKFTAGVERTSAGLVVRFAKPSEAYRLEFSDAVISLQLVDSRGFVKGAREELIIDILIREALSTGDNTKVDEYVDEVIAGGSKEEIQGLGAKLAASDIEEYTLAGAKTAEEAVSLMTQSGNMGAFSSPIATWDEYGLLNLNDADFSYNMMSLEKGKGEAVCDGLFRGSNLASFAIELPSLTNGGCMFNGCSKLSSFTSNIPNLTDGRYMFNYCRNLTSFTIDLPSLTNGEHMFQGCSKLTAFTSNLPNLTNGQYMFNSCEKLTSFTSELPSLTEGGCMFDNCSSLTSFTSELPNLTDGQYMFNCCRNLTSFTSNLPSLTNGQGMFGSCNSLTYCEPKNCKNSTALNEIIESLPYYNKADGSHVILFSTGDDDLNAQLTTQALSKGWGVGTEDVSAYYYYGSGANDNPYYELVDGSSMFYGDDSLREWNYDMPNLTNGSEMFEYCRNLTSFTISLPSLTNGGRMFSNCRNLTSFTSDLPSLTNGGQMFYECSSLTSFTSELPKLEYGAYMFAHGPIESWDIDLPKLTNGYEMFNYCTKLSSFTADLSSLTDGNMMFYCCRSLTSFTCDLPKLTNGNSMFSYCYSLTSFTSQLPNLEYAYYMFVSGPIETFNTDLPKLTVGSEMFQSCDRLTSFTSSLPNLTNGSGMFKGCGSLTYCEPKNCKNSTSLNQIINSLPTYDKADGSHMILFSTGNEELNDDLTVLALDKGWGVGTEDLNGSYYYYGFGANDNPYYELVDGSGMFSYDTSLTEWNYDMPKLTNGSNMFYNCYKLTSFTTQLSSLTNGEHMFGGCDSLASFTADLPKLTNGDSMFSNSYLTSFTSELPSLTNGHYMFSGCSYLTSFTSELPKLTNGSVMFSGCSNLTSFTSDLSKLDIGDSMFSGCKLDTPSIQRIANSLPTYTDGTHNMYITSGATTLKQEELDAHKLILSKGWGSKMNFRYIKGEVKDVDFSGITNAFSMFEDCSWLTSWTAPLPEYLTDASNMFYKCSRLTSWTVALPESLTNASRMFEGCRGLTSWTAILPQSLTNASYMFSDCSNLSSFTPWGKNEDVTLKDTGATGKLANGYQMFHYCKLDLASVKRIADWLPQRSSSKPTGSESTNGWIHIGVASGVNSGTEFNNAISKMTSKNWSVVICVNGNHTTK